jgi:hypothetical protein
MHSSPLDQFRDVPMLFASKRDHGQDSLRLFQVDADRLPRRPNGTPCLRFSPVFAVGDLTIRMKLPVPKFDKYTLFARLFPAVIAAAPALALAWVIATSGTEIKLVHGIAGTALAVLLVAFVLGSAQIIRSHPE